MYNKKNKKGVSPLIATVLIIGFTIVLAALVITWGTKLFKGTVADTEASSKFNLACTTDLNFEVVGNPVILGNSPTRNAANVSIFLRNNNQVRQIEDFNVLIYDAAGNVVSTDQGISIAAITPIPAGTQVLVFPTPKNYMVNVATNTPANAPLTNLTVAKLEVYPKFNIDGVTKSCSTPLVINLK